MRTYINWVFLPNYFLISSYGKRAVSTALSTMMKEGFDVKALRAFRVLRPLRLVSGVPSKPLLVPFKLVSILYLRPFVNQKVCKSSSIQFCEPWYLCSTSRSSSSLSSSSMPSSVWSFSPESCTRPATILLLVCIYKEFYIFIFSHAYRD